MARYRYRTAVLLGPWRNSAGDAEADAVDAGQALREADNRLRWRVPGRIEVAADEEDGSFAR